MAGVLEQMAEPRKPESMCSYLMYICQDLESSKCDRDLRPWNLVKGGHLGRRMGRERGFSARLLD